MQKPLYYIDLHWLKNFFETKVYAYTVAYPEF